MTTENELRTLPSVADGLHFGVRQPGAIGLVYAPGNGVRYELLFFELGWAPSFCGKIGKQLGSWVVVWLNAGKSMVLAPNGFLHPSYVAEKLSCSIETGVVLAEVFAYVLPGRTAIACEEWGKDREHGNGGSSER